jgi:hypothetical protein
VVAFRFDLCAPTSALATEAVPEVMKSSIPGCLVQIRLITQPRVFRKNNPHNKLGDMSAHLVFNLGVIPRGDSMGQFRENAKPFLPILHELQAIKRKSKAKGADTDGKPLDVHPGLQLEIGERKGEIGESVKSFLKTYSKNLSAIAFVGTIPERPGVVPDEWIFLSGTLSTDSSGVKHFVQIPNLAYHQTKVMTVKRLARLFDNIGVFQKRNDLIIPKPEDDSLAISDEIFHLDEAKAMTAEQSTIIANVLHPERSHVFNTDCVSCHSNRELMLGSANAKGRYVIPKGISAYVSPKAVPKSSWNLRNFGWSDDNGPSISLRTATETASVVDLTNTVLGGIDHANPGLDCGNDRKILDEIWNCSARPEDGVSCYEACKVVGQPK